MLVYYSEIVGFVAWSKSGLFVLDMVRFRIESLIVAEWCRGRGIGTKLITCVEDIAKAYKPATIDLTSGLRRASDGAHEFYKGLGYQNDGPMAKVYLRKEL
jgi:ribosomal protein S18 acetylase RimI-like enzyme